MDQLFNVTIVGEMASSFDMKKGNVTVETLLPRFSALDVRRENLLIAVASSPFLEVSEVKYVLFLSFSLSLSYFYSSKKGGTLVW